MNEIKKLYVFIGEKDEVEGIFGKIGSDGMFIGFVTPSLKNARAYKKAADETGLPYRIVLFDRTEDIAII